jgi:aspartate racemase
LFHHYTRQDDILIGIPVADRDRPELESLIGFFIDTQALRTDLAGDPTFSELLGRVQRRLIDVYSHRSAPFERVLETVKVEHTLSYSPLFQVMFNWRERGAQLQFVGLPGLTVEALVVQNRISKFDLSFNLTEEFDDIVLEVEYSTDLFDDDRIVRMVGHYCTLLEAVAADPHRRVADLPLLTDSERHQILVKWNHIEADHPKERCLHELVEEQAQLAPEAVALVFEGLEMTYAELNHRANHLGAGLKEAGAGPRVVVGLCLERSMEMVIAILAILRSGAAYLPLDHNLPRARLAFMLEDAGVSLVLTCEKLREAIPAPEESILCIDKPDWPSRSANTCASSGAADPAYVMYTSGSTGAPKGVIVPHRAIPRLVRNANYIQISPNDVFLQLAPISFDASTFEIWGALLNGARLVIPPPHVPSLEELGRRVRDEKVTILWLTAGWFHQMADSQLAALRGLRYLVAGGEALSVAHVLKAARQLKNCQLINGYGPTEGTTFTCCFPVPASWAGGASVPIGRPINRTRVYILDSARNPAPIGVPGELYIGGDGLACGYLNSPELTAGKFVTIDLGGGVSERLYRSGDLARWLTDGNIEFIGRMDNQVKIRGFRVEPGEIESALAAHPRVREAVVVALPDHADTLRLIAYVVGRPGQIADAAELREYLGSKLPDYMVPSGFVMLDALPLSTNGKVDRKSLPKPEFQAAADRFLPPSTPMEMALAKIWREVLGVKQVGLRDNFFDLGGHSLLAIQLVGEIRRQMKFDLPVREVFQQPTFGALAKTLVSQNVSERRSNLVELQAGTKSTDLFFLIDDGSMGLFKLGRLIGDSWPIYASVALLPEEILRASAKWQFSKFPKLNQIVGKHVALIQSRQSSNPLILLGHCFGGRIAFEVAHLLQRAGQEVQAVFLLDTWMKGPTSRWWWKRTWLQAHLQKLSQQGPRYFWRKSRRRIHLEKDRLAERLQLAIHDEFNLHVPWPIIQRIHRYAVKGYVPRVLHTRGCLFVSKDDWASIAFRKRENSLGASELFANGVEVFDVPGDHVTILDEPHLPELAQCIRLALANLHSSQALQEDPEPMRAEAVPAQ